MENQVVCGEREVGNEDLIGILHAIMNSCVTFLTVIAIASNMFQAPINLSLNRVVGGGRKYSLLHRVPRQVQHLQRVVGVSDEECINQLRMSRGAFSNLCHLIETRAGLSSNRNTTVAEQVAMFLSILAHHTKMRIIKSNFKRSSRTVSRNFHRVLNSIIKLHPILLAKQVPIDEACTNERWNSFKGCLGALDDTYIDVTVPKADQARYRNRKGQVYVNVLAVCDINMNFIYVLSGWEGSAADSQVLRDAVARPNGLRVPRASCYYLCDGGYTQAEGFLTPYRGARYHIGEWVDGGRVPQSKEEYFNMKHSKARNVIERSFRILKKRWAILRSTSFYMLKIQNRIIMASFLLHNFIRTAMAVHPLEGDIPDGYGVEDNGIPEFVDGVESGPQWVAWRENLAHQMFATRGN